jgi:hemerythrin superfamily protein
LLPKPSTLPSHGTIRRALPMNAIELLKADHETVSGLFRTFESAKKSGGEKRQIVDRICRELDAHARVEEELFYPAVEKRAQEDEKAEQSVLEAHEEHALVKTLVHELRGGGSGGDDGRLEAKVKVLKDLVDHHVEEEESTLMPRARKLLSGEELDELGERVQARKQELAAEPARPEPRSTRGSSSSRSRRGSAPSRRRASASARERRSKSGGSPRGGRRGGTAGTRRRSR